MLSPDCLNTHETADQGKFRMLKIPAASLKRLGVDERIILRWIFRKWDGGGRTMDRSGSGEGQVAGDCGNAPSGSIKCGEFLD